MIPEVFIENWRKTVPWQMTEQIQQDLMRRVSQRNFPIGCSQNRT